ncbi:hypothetical protein J2T10_001866 [Paenarthrobacter nicotinovorans]|uniref:Chlorite dismutase n=1 Tax=Paenarthrobacter nicotinovorans TaxID=29320 RepID=A0ABT9TKP4_PAENI|nr:hypothetical protein [Paenarthrobacter nicotinovorans]MDQ0102220.1 hypothetical protein [Paenarthrobacter nicotinovorans]GAT87684.1 hypothetical protein CVCC1112_2343 [Paenarthrobacter nicotinovorans]
MPARFPQSNAAYPTGQQWEYLVWLTAEATPGMPRIEELTSAWAAANTAVARVSYQSFKNQERARDEYFRIIGQKPVLEYTSSAPSETVDERKVKRPCFGQAAAAVLCR